MRARPYRPTRTDPAVDAAVARHGTSPVVALPVLRDVQAATGRPLDRTVLGAAADALHVNDARVYGTASFYSLLAVAPDPARVVRVCDGPVCLACGGAAARAAVEAAAAGTGWAVDRTSCLGQCDRAPAALVGLEPAGPITGENAAAALAGRSEPMPSYADPRPGEVRVVMARVGRIDPDSIDDALAAGAYRALARALAGPPAAVLDAVDQAGLRGCGGAGFPAGRKWRTVADAAGSRKYVICNADESEPATFKDRVLLEGDPHLLLEGMALAAYAVGAAEGIVYVRGEYEWVARRLERAAAQAAERGWLGNNIRGRGFSFRVHVHRGAGAYVCGEETALLESLEGKRGSPRFRPPYSATHGYLGRPTLMNNVETLCHVPAIAARGPEWFRSLGTAHSPGTKVFCLTGCVNRPGVFEAPFGATLRQLIDQFGGGVRPGSRLKGVLAGGAAGTIVPPALFDVPLDFASARQGVALGSGGMFAFDESVSVPTLLSWLLHFFEVESCGKCTPCREGTREARAAGERVAAGRGADQDVAQLQRLARQMNLTSLCGLGQSVAWPVESALRHFASEFAARSGGA
jgi:NADH-quinone oxidoreductase subunit F